MEKFSEEDLASLSIISEDELINQFAIETLEPEDIISSKNGLEKELLNMCEELSSFYDDLNIQRLADDELKNFLVTNGLKTKKDIYLYLLYRDETMIVESSLIEQLYKVIYPYYRLKEKVLNNDNLLLIDGNYYRVNKDNVLGYCHYKLHKGYVTKNLLEQHECLKKGCPFLEKYEKNIFWEERKNNKALKKNTKQIKNKEKETLLLFQKEAELYIKSKGYDLVITDIYKDNMERYLVYFVTKLNKNEEVKYYDIANHLKEKFKKDFVMRKPIKTDGRYATIDDIEKTCKNKN